MKRQDTTTVQYQATFRGRHVIPGTGVWSYPPKPTRYLRCPCGWRLVAITRTQMRKAYAEHAEHVRKVTPI